MYGNACQKYCYLKYTRLDFICYNFMGHIRAVNYNLSIPEQASNKQIISTKWPIPSVTTLNLTKAAEKEGL